MAKKGYWVIRKYEAGAVGESIKYWVPGDKPTKSERRLKSEIRKQQQNEASAEKRMARQIHANFTSGDYLIGLDYSAEGLAMTVYGLNREAPQSGTSGPRLANGEPAEDDKEYANKLYHAAHHQLRLWIGRVREACRKAGAPFRYIAITSDMDGKTGEAKRVHHHVIINAEALEIALKKWTRGGTHHEHLYNVVDQTALAAYLLNQVRRLPDEKKYIPSRNLITPMPKDRIARSGAELAVPRGGQLLHRNEYRPGRPQYIRYILPEVGKIRKGKKPEKEDEAGGPTETIS
ncbi:MAG: hypothetical protein HDT16_01975 [Oscillibacter sp.]|nr:hypothetical protein [Oscillibacter sp.]